MSPFHTTAPFTFILFGASGHLARNKIYPALYVLALKKRLPERYAVVGFSRTEMADAEFRAFVEKAIREAMLEVTEKALKEFLTHVHYHAGQYDDAADYTKLAERLGGGLEEKNAVRLAYLSVPPSVFPEITKHLCKGGIHDGKTPFRCIVEKPVGHDVKSFEEVRSQLISCFSEEEIYLLDHYLGKEAVRNVYYLRWANPVVERILKNTLLNHVEVSALEDFGLEGRAGYFESVGTFRDMFQSHLLMIGSLLTMRLLTEGEIAEGRLDALSQFYLPPATDLSRLALQGQYTGGLVAGKNVSGYQDEEGVKKASRTATFACLKLMTRISRWVGVPFYFRSGKRLEKKETRISLQFQEPRSIGKGATKNRLDIIMQGEAGMRLHIQTKMGGTEPEFRPLIMEDPLVCVGDCLPEHGLLILEAIHGKKQWFPMFREVETAWRLIDPVQVFLDNSETPLHAYPAGSRGPEAADAWIEKEGLKWF